MHISEIFIFTAKAAKVYAKVFKGNQIYILKEQYKILLNIVKFCWQSF